MLTKLFQLMITESERLTALIVSNTRSFWTQT
jgi:hypothetical protein